jgi:long-chain acyl-CoA synthetase
LPPGQPGLLYAEMAEGTQVIYHKSPEKTASALHPAHPDWMCVGDLGYLDNDGYLYLTDRKSFMIISGGVNIYPQQIEDALAMHPKLQDVAVIGVPHPELGEEALAVIQLADGVSADEELVEEFKEFVREKLGRQLVPRTIEFVEELPRMPTGKLNKHQLRDHYSRPEPTS